MLLIFETKKEVNLRQENFNLFFFLENRVQNIQWTIKSIHVLSQCIYIYIFVYLVEKPIGMFNCFFSFFLFSFVFHFILFSIRHSFLLLFILFLKRSTYCSTIEAFVFPRMLVLVYIPFSCFTFFLKFFFPLFLYE